MASTLQYSTRTRGDDTCSIASCCGSYDVYYNCGCKTYACQYVWIGSGEQGAGGTIVKYYASCPSKIGYDYYFEFSSCSEPKLCSYPVSYTCTKPCCGYTNWTGWSSWGSGYWCNNTYCQSQSRTVYY